MSVPDEGYSRNASSVLNLISNIPTFFHPTCDTVWSDADMTCTISLLYTLQEYLNVLSANVLVLTGYLFLFVYSNV